MTNARALPGQAVRFILKDKADSGMCGLVNTLLTEASPGICMTK